MVSNVATRDARNGADPSANQAGTASFAAPDPQEPLVDARIRPLLQRYVALVNAELSEVASGLVELRLPASERKWFRNRSRIKIAFTLDALEGDPEAEIAVVGSALVEQLTGAIRARGARASHGKVPPKLSASAEAAALGVPITNGKALEPSVDVAWHRAVRLLARVIVHAGSAVEEHLVESGFLDAATGAPISSDIATSCIEAGTLARSAAAGITLPDELSSFALVSARPTAELINLALTDLRASLETRVTTLREQARRALAEELHRIDGYYTAMLNDAAGRGSQIADAAARRAVEAEHARRRAEEERRHQVHAIVHPVQMTEWELLVQRAQWELVSGRGLRATIVAERWLNGAGEWALACAQCGSATVQSLSVCKSGHAACDTCSRTCGVCRDVFCWDHGIQACHVDGAPACAEHARSCVSCREPYCVAHEAICADGEHSACSECVAPCAICGRHVCEEHAKATVDTSPRGRRRLCMQCIRYCEGGTSEPVGVDEVTRCTSCEQYVCEQHRSTCAVDQSIHCSRHLRRTDASRRLVCEHHREQCAFEPGAIFASDEVGACTSCGRQACDRHSHACVEDGRRYCEKDSIVLRNEPGTFVCRTHAAICQVDEGAFRLGETTDCPVCAKATCNKHLRSCSWCGREVCVTDLSRPGERCTTCTQLREVADPPDAIVDAVATAMASNPTPKRWRLARDSTHTVVDLDLGWTRRAVLAVRHGDNVAGSGMSHSAIGSRKLSLA